MRTLPMPLAPPSTNSARPAHPTPAPSSGLHFLAVMPDEESEVCSGLWLLLDRKPPSV